MINAEGKKLLDFCDYNGLIILNGRCEGDWEENCTYVGEGAGNGSVIDYLIVSESSDRYIKRIEV